jgi:Flp pilus assembly pilin Flp
VHFWQDESGQDMIEYALVACFVGLSTVTGLHGLAVAMSGYLSDLINGFEGALAGHL